MGRFEDALRRPGLGGIAEIKRRSPSAGDLRPDADPARIAPAYARAGAAAISVLVDDRFGGSWDDLRAARASTDAPLLAKGFFSTVEHLRTAKEAGADAALLILRDLDDERGCGPLGPRLEPGPGHARRGPRRRRARAGDRARSASGRRQRARPLDVRDRPCRAARARRDGARRPDRDRGVGDRVACAGRRSRARRRGRDPRRVDADAGAGSRRQAARAAVSPAGQGVRTDARGGRLGRRRGRRRSARLRARAGEPAGGRASSPRPRDGPHRRRVGRRGRPQRRRPRPGAHGGGREGARTRGDPLPGRRAGRAAPRPPLGRGGSDALATRREPRRRPSAASCSPAVSARRTSPMRSLRCGPGRSTPPRRWRSRPASRTTPACGPTWRRHVADRRAERGEAKPRAGRPLSSRRPSASTAASTSPRR